MPNLNSLSIYQVPRKCGYLALNSNWLKFFFSWDKFIALNGVWKYCEDCVLLLLLAPYKDFHKNFHFYTHSPAAIVCPEEEVGYSMMELLSHWESRVVSVKAKRFEPSFGVTNLNRFIIIFFENSFIWFNMKNAKPNELKTYKPNV